MKGHRKKSATISLSAIEKVHLLLRSALNQAVKRMVVDLYAHTHNEDRRRLAQKMDEDFFQSRPAENKKAAADEADLAYQLLQNNPEMAKLIIAALGGKSST